MSENKEDKNEKQKDYRYVVGIGASAGGLEALQKLLTNLPGNTGFPFIIIQHLSPDYKSLLGEILSKYTTMPVLQAENGMSIKPDCVYVIQPGRNMRINKGKLMLTPQKEHELNLPIDIFFHSLADDMGRYGIAVVLSGTGSDGTNGIKSVKDADGMVIVQSPEDAKFDGMPRSAIRTGLADAVLNADEIAAELYHISERSIGDLQPLDEQKEISSDLLDRVYFILKKISGVNFSHYKQSTIMRRVERRMMLTHKETLQEYVDSLYEMPDEAKTLSKEVLIGVTSFFRDPEYFEKLKEKAIKNILVHSVEEEPVRVWVAGCSTGEEAYSIAILFSEAMDALRIKRTLKIFATDLDVEAITTASKGVYGENISEAVSTARLSKYFTRRNNTYVISREIRKMVVFSPHNVFQDPPFGRLDLISCRNMMIYFQPVLQNDLFAIFHTALKDGGFLFLGKSEAVGSYTEVYPVVDAAAKIFTHRSDAQISGAKVIPFLQTPITDETFMGNDAALFNYQPSSKEIDAVEQVSIDISLLEQYMPACLVVNDKNELVHTYGENSNYVHLAVGEFSNSLYDILTEALKVPVSTILKESRERHQKIQYREIHFSGERKDAIINMTAMPINRRNNNVEILTALIFTESSQHEDLTNAVPYEIDRIASQRITDLEQDLSEAQDKLMRSTSEQETVNEELQAANEELLTANEELQSSNEELQSVNEELYTVNNEYQLRMTELANLNDDIANFLSTTMIAIIFVDNKLNIRRFTNYANSEFSVMDHDIGRSLEFISYQFPQTDIIGICKQVLKTLVPVEHEVATARNKVYFMRVTPYRTVENKILGCVLTWMDISKQKQSQTLLESTEERLQITQQASNAKSDFLARMSHEIRIPMNTLISLAEVAEEQKRDPDAVDQNMKQLRDTVNYMTAIFADILDMSKLENSSIDLVNVPFVMQDLIDRVVHMITPHMQSSGLRFDVDLGENLSIGYLGDENRLHQILINFLNNAIKYTPRGGSVTLRAFEDFDLGKQVSICFIISDTGIGISKKFLPEMFKPFAKEDEADMPNPSMGLGMSIAYSLVRLMGGDVKVESEVGKGSTFTIQVVLEKYALKEGLKPDTSNHPRDYGLRGYRVMVVEDNAANRSLTAALLAQQGMSCDEALNGAEALQKFTDSPLNFYDCILMDMRMPTMNGMDATSAIRALDREDAASVPIIGVSADGFPEDIQSAHLAGMNGYLTKPIDVGKLLATIKAMIK